MYCASDAPHGLRLKRPLRSTLQAATATGRCTSASGRRETGESASSGSGAGVGEAGRAGEGSDGGCVGGGALEPQAGSGGGPGEAARAGEGRGDCAGSGALEPEDGSGGGPGAARAGEGSGECTGSGSGALRPSAGEGDGCPGSGALKPAKMSAWRGQDSGITGRMLKSLASTWRHGLHGGCRERQVTARVSAHRSDF